MLVMVSNNPHSRWHAVSRANKPMENTAKAHANVLISIFDFIICARVGVSGQKPPVVDPTHAFSRIRLRETPCFKVLDESLINAFVSMPIYKSFTRIAAG